MSAQYLNPNFYFVSDIAENSEKAMILKEYCCQLSFVRILKRILIENQIANIEIQRGNTFYIESYSMEFEAFENQLKENFGA